jgi:hypothetical protein
MPLKSLALRLKEAFGFRQKAATIVPTTRKQAYYRTIEGIGEAGNLAEGITRRQPVSFYYEDRWQTPGTPGRAGVRVGNPHAMWKGNNGTTYIHMYVDPRSATATGQLPGWRTFIVSRIRGVSTLELGNTFFGKPVQFPLAPGYNPNWYSGQGTPLYLAK